MGFREGTPSPACVSVHPTLARMWGWEGACLLSVALFPSSFPAGQSCLDLHPASALWATARLLRGWAGGRCHSAPYPGWGRSGAPAGCRPQAWELSSAETCGPRRPWPLGFEALEGTGLLPPSEGEGRSLLRESLFYPAGQRGAIGEWHTCLSLPLGSHTDQEQTRRGPEALPGRCRREEPWRQTGLSSNPFSAASLSGDPGQVACSFSTSVFFPI